MNILQVTHKLPFPLTDGGSIAINSVTTGLSALNHTVKVIGIETHKHPFIAEAFPNGYIDKQLLKTVVVDTRIKPLGALFHLIKNKSYHLSRFYSKEFELELVNALKNDHFDVVHLESIYLARYIPAIKTVSTAKVVLRTHNVEHKIWQRLADGTKGILKRWYLNILTKQLKKEELQLLQLPHSIASISEVDTHFIKTHTPVPCSTISFGIDLEKFSAENTIEPHTNIYHIGSMDWKPNQEGVDWFISNCWNRLKETPNLNLHIAGKNMPKKYFDVAAPNTIIHGQVASLHSFVKGKQIMVVPLFSGSGIRIKVIEAMAMGKIVISTSVGAEGIPYTDGKDIIIANTMDEFIVAIEKISLDKELMKKISKNARELVEKNFDNHIIAKRLEKLYLSELFIKAN